MQLLEVSGAVRPIYGSLGVKMLRACNMAAPPSLNLLGAISLLSSLVS